MPYGFSQICVILSMSVKIFKIRTPWKKLEQILKKIVEILRKFIKISQIH